MPVEQRFTPEEILQATELYPSLWMEQHEIKTSNGLPFEFDNHGFMIDVINDMSPFQVGLKPPQIGWSESMIVKSFYVSDKKEKDIIYTLPTATDRDDMVNSKVNRIIAQNPILQQMVKDHDTVEQKAVGNHLIHYRGTFAAKQAMMVSSDLNIHDETDASDPEVITQYETRLAANPEGMRWYFSHPSRSGRGVDIYWQQSNKREWFISCPNCLKEQFLTWPDNINKELGIYICSSCKQELLDEVRKKGKWKATDKGVFSGYHISQMMCPWISAKRILEAYQDPMKSEQYFYNYVLGLPYKGGDDSITKEQVLQNVRERPLNSQDDPVIIGVDTGLPIYYCLMNKQGVFHFNKTGLPSGNYKPYDELRGFLKHWPRSKMVIDGRGDLNPALELQQEFKGRVFLGFLRSITKTTDVVQWGEKDKYGEVAIDRNRMLDLVVEWLKDGRRIALNGTRDEWTPFAQHFENIWREELLTEDKPNKDNKALYGTDRVWKGRKPDHWVFALLFALVGYDKFGNMPDVQTGDVNDDWFNTIKTGRIFVE